MTQQRWREREIETMNEERREWDDRTVKERKEKGGRQANCRLGMRRKLYANEKGIEERRKEARRTIGRYEDRRTECRKISPIGRREDRAV